MAGGLSDGEQVLLERLCSMVQETSDRLSSHAAARHDEANQRAIAVERLASSQMELDQLKEELEQCRAALSDLQDRHATVQTALSERDAELGHLTEHLERRDACIERLSAELQTLESSNKLLRSNISTLLPMTNALTDVLKQADVMPVGERVDTNARDMFGNLMSIGVAAAAAAVVDDPMSDTEGETPSTPSDAALLARFGHIRGGCSKCRWGGSRTPKRCSISCYRIGSRSYMPPRGVEVD